MLDPLPIKIIHRRLVRHLGEKPAEVPRGHLHRAGQVVKRYVPAVILLHIIHHLLQLDYSPVIPSRPGDTLKVIMLSKNNPEKVIKLSYYRQLVTIIHILKRVKDIIHCPDGFLLIGCQVMKNHDFLVENPLQIWRDSRGTSQQ